MHTYRIMHPEYATVTPERIYTWYTDAVANGEVNDYGSVSPDRAANILHEAGLITLANATLPGAIGVPFVDSYDGSR